MPSCLLKILVRVAESVLPVVINVLECKYPGFKVAVDEVKKILGDANATPATPVDLAGHIKNFK